MSVAELVAAVMALRADMVVVMARLGQLEAAPPKLDKQVDSQVDRSPVTGGQPGGQGGQVDAPKVDKVDSLGDGQGAAFSRKQYERDYKRAKRAAAKASSTPPSE